jgi:hypothetical protein
LSQGFHVSLNSLGQQLGQIGYDWTTVTVNRRDDRSVPFAHAVWGGNQSMVQDTIDIRVITKRDGRQATFDRDKIVTAIMKAAHAVAGSDRDVAQALTDQVLERLNRLAREQTPSVELTQDIIEKVLIENGHARTAKAFILHRAKRSRIREGKSELMDLVADIMQPDETPDLNVSPPPLAVGLAASQQFSLNRILTEGDAEAHHGGLWHVHDLALYGQVSRALILTPENLFQDKLHVGGLIIGRPTDLEQATDWLRLLLAQAKEWGYAHVSLDRFDQAMAPFAINHDDVGLKRCLRALLVACNAGAMPGHIHLRLSDTPDAAAQRVTLALLEIWMSLRENASQPIQPRIVMEWSRSFDEARRDARVCEAATLAVRKGCIAFEKCFLPDGYSASALLSLNVPRIALEAKQTQSSLAGALQAVIRRAGILLKDQHQRVLAQANRNPLARYEAPHRPAAISLMGFAHALPVIADEDDFGATLQQTNVLLNQCMAEAAKFATPEGWGVVLTNYQSETIGATFVRQDRRAFGILRGVTDVSAYDGNLARMAHSHPDATFWSTVEQLEQPLAGGHIISIQRSANPSVTDCLDWLETVWRSHANGIQF